MWYDRTSSYHSSVAESPYFCPRNSEPIWSEFRGLFIEVCSLQCNYGTKGQLALLQQFFTFKYHIRVLFLILVSHFTPQRYGEKMKFE